MKIAHWSLSNSSGLNKVAYNISEAERELGHNSVFIATDKHKDGELDETEWENGMDADVHVVHSTLPDKLRGTDAKIVFIPHGTPEVCFLSAVESMNPGAWGLTYHWLKTADAIVTFWPRHEFVWKSLSNKNTLITTIPLGVNKEFWMPVKSRGKYVGEPSFLICENSHQIKWCYDVALAWHTVTKSVGAAKLHINYLPSNQHPAFFPLFYSSGIMSSSFITGNRLGAEDLRNAFVSVDYYINPVRYGDFNAIGLEAKASGCKVISYVGNPYADYWLSSMDQRVIASELIGIAKGDIQPRSDILEPCDISVTASYMIKIYERITHVTQVQTMWSGTLCSESEHQGNGKHTADVTEEVAS